MTWGMIGAAAVAVVGGSMASKGGSSGSGGGAASGNSPQYVGTDLAGVDNTWQSLFNANADTAKNTAGQVQGGFDQTLANQRGIDYTGFMNSAGAATNAYNRAGTMGMQQGDDYTNMANVAKGQQAKMYGYGDQIMNTAMDPQQALYNRTQQQLTDQTRAGQAARGLGNSAEGSMEEAGAMGNFNIDWQNAQLGRQVQGMNAASQANAGGIAQGNLYGQNQAAAMNAVGQGAGYYGQAGKEAMGAQQYVANAPGQASQQYLTGMQGVQGLYGTAMNGAQSYMGMGQSAQQANYNANAANNQATTTGISQLAGQAIPAAMNWYGNQNQQQNWNQGARDYGGGQTGGGSDFWGSEGI